MSDEEPETPPASALRRRRSSLLRQQCITSLETQPDNCDIEKEIEKQFEEAARRAQIRQQMEATNAESCALSKMDTPPSISIDDSDCAPSGSDEQTSTPTSRIGPKLSQLFQYGAGGSSGSNHGSLEKNPVARKIVTDLFQNISIDSESQQRLLQDIASDYTDMETLNHSLESFFESFSQTSIDDNLEDVLAAFHEHSNSISGAKTNDKPPWSTSVSQDQSIDHSWPRRTQDESIEDDAWRPNSIDDDHIVMQCGNVSIEIQDYSNTPSESIDKVTCGTVEEPAAVSEYRNTTNEAESVGVKDDNNEELHYVLSDVKAKSNPENAETSHKSPSGKAKQVRWQYRPSTCDRAPMRRTVSQSASQEQKTPVVVSTAARRGSLTLLSKMEVIDVSFSLDGSTNVSSVDEVDEDVDADDNNGKSVTERLAFNEHKIPFNFTGSTESSIMTSMAEEEEDEDSPECAGRDRKDSCVSVTGRLALQDCRLESLREEWESTESGSDEVADDDEVDKTMISKWLQTVSQNAGNQSTSLEEDDDEDYGRVNPSSLRYAQHEPESQDDDVKENSQEIKRASKLIQREMERERKMRLMAQPLAGSTSSPPRNGRRSASPGHISAGRASPKPPRRGDRSTRSMERLSTAGCDRCHHSPEVQRTDEMFDKELIDKVAELEVLQESIRSTKEDRQKLLNEIRSLQDTVKQQEAEIKQLDKHAHEGRSKAENTRTDWMLNEFKRDNAQKELSQVLEDIGAKRQQLTELQEHIRTNMERLREFEEVGMSGNEIKQVLSERETLSIGVAQKENQRQSLERECQELRDQLQSTKEELFSEQRKARNKTELLEEKIESVSSRLEECEVSRAELSALLDEERLKCNAVLYERDHVMGAKESEFEDSRQRLQKELAELKKHTHEEADKFRDEVDKANLKAATLLEELQNKDEVTSRLRNQILDQEADLKHERGLRDRQASDLTREMEAVRKEKEKIVKDLRENAYADKNCALNDVQQKFELERRDLLSRTETKLSEQIAQHHHELMERDDENMTLRERLRELEEIQQTLGDKIKQETSHEMKEMLNRELKALEQERDGLWKRELTKIGEESSKAVQKAKEDAEREREISSHLERQIDVIKAELEEQRLQNRQIYQDKVVAVNKAKDFSRHEKDEEIEELKIKYDDALQQAQLEIRNLQETLQQQQENLQHLSAKHTAQFEREQENVSIMEKQEKTVVHEINEDCRKTALILGINPRKVNSADFNDPCSPLSQTSPTMAALANLRACNEELRKMVQEVKTEVDTTKQLVLKVQKHKHTEIETLKEKLYLDKNREMDLLRERLIKDHLGELNRIQLATKDTSLKKSLEQKDNELREIQKNMNKWKEEVAEKFAKKFEEELNRELDKRAKDMKRVSRDKDRFCLHQQREMERLEREVARHTSSAQHQTNGTLAGNDDHNAVKLLRTLQERVKELRSENMKLKRHSISTSNPNLSSHDSGMDVIRNLEQRIKQSEFRADLAEERAQRNESIMTDKMTEIGKLQTSLTQQTKELMQLERAYSQLQTQVVQKSPTRSSSSRVDWR